MGIEKIYIARHGFRLNWVNSSCENVTGLPRDPPLAAHGEVQARELADYFLSLPEDQRPTAIFSSPYYRCLQTSQPIAQALGLPIHVEHGIAAWYSPVVPDSNLLHPRPGLAFSLKQYFPEIDTITWLSPIWYPSRKGESVEEVHNRVEGFLSVFPVALELKKADIDDHRVLFVTHGSIAIVLARSLLDDREIPLRIGCCSLSEFELKPEAKNILGACKAIKLADGAHLKQGSLREWGFDGMVFEYPGEPGTEEEEDFPIGPQIHILNNL